MSDSPRQIVLGKETPVTFAVLILVVGLAFSMGIFYQKQLTQESRQNQLEEAINILAELSRDNKHRIDLMEDRNRRGQ